MLEFQFSLPLRILREPVLALFPVPPPTAGCVSLGHGREGGGELGLGKMRLGRVWKNLWTALETGEVIPSSP